MNPPASSAAPRPLQQGSVAELREQSHLALVPELAEFETERSAKDLERLAEAQIMTLLQLQGFDPRCDEWKSLADALASYGFVVMRGWGLSGLLRRKAAQHANGFGVIGLPKLPEVLELDEFDASSLAADLVVKSIDSYRQTLMDPDRRWRFDGGASLKSFFIGRCLQLLPDVYVKWRRQERGDLIEVALDATIAHPQIGDPADHHLDWLLNDLVDDPSDRAMFALQHDGYTLEQIAEILSADLDKCFTEGMVRTHMTNARKRARKRRTRPR